MGRKLVVVRHGERVDFTFGMDWFVHCFDDAGNYTKNNLNMPDRMIRRSNMPVSYNLDGPLTQVGELQGILAGKGFKENDTFRPGFQVYVSPSLRSIQTAAAIMAGMGQPDMPLRIEPCLFEWTGWVLDGLPRFTTPDELVAHGYSIDTQYTPLTRLEDLEVPESVETYYVRTHELVKKLLEQSGEFDGDILLVAHGATLDTATRQLVGGQPRKDSKDMMVRLKELPYACIAVAEKDETSGKWSINPPGNLTLRHGSNHYFNCSKQFSETSNI